MLNTFTKIIGLPAVLFFSVLVSCSDNKELTTYDHMVRAGLDSGVRNDSLFLGYKFGMTRDEFHRLSWEMNQEQRITGLTHIEYKPDFLPHAATMRFYPEFVDDRIAQMPVELFYDAWSPWNHDHSPESLLTDVLDVYEARFGGAFHRVHVPELEREAHVMVAGNLCLVAYVKSENSIQVEFTDLSVEAPGEDVQPL